VPPGLFAFEAGLRLPLPAFSPSFITVFFFFRFSPLFPLPSPSLFLSLVCKALGPFKAFVFSLLNGIVDGGVEASLLLVHVSFTSSDIALSFHLYFSRSPGSPFAPPPVAHFVSVDVVTFFHSGSFSPLPP